MNNLLDILNKCIGYLKEKKIGNERIIVEKIFSEVLNINRIMLYANFEKNLSEDEIKKIKSSINKYIQNNENSINDFGLNSFDDERDSVKKLLDKSVNYLEKNNINESKLISEIIFSHVLKIDRMMLFTKYKDIVENEEKDKIRKYIQKIGKEKFPLQYLLNEQQFYGRTFYVNKGVLIPRNDTEVLVEEVMKIVKKEHIENPKILDIGIGSGAIGITLALEMEKSKIMGVDISENAIEIANKNKELLNAKNIKIIKSNLFENVEYKEFDIIVSNPPYIDKEHVNIMSEDTMYEPIEAFFAENEGLYFYYEISRQGYSYIKKDGYLAFEIGCNQAESVKQIMIESGYSNIEIIKDMSGLDRVILGKK